MLRKPHQPRFVRLSQEHASAIFGPDESLEPWMVISAGRYVAKQRVALVGPIVEKTQVSLADQDIERLGLEVGSTDEKQRVLLVGPAGEARVDLKGS